MKSGDKIKVHIYNSCGNEILTANHDKVFTVYEQNGRLGIDWKGFTPLDHFATGCGAVCFEEVTV